MEFLDCKHYTKILTERFNQMEVDNRLYAHNLSITPFKITTTDWQNLSFQNQCLKADVTLFNVCYSVFMGLLLFVSLSGNLLVVVAILMSPGLRRKIASLFIGSLACSDFLYAALLIPFRISVRLHNSWFCHNLPTCYLFILSDTFCNTSSILNLLVLAIDRYFAIKYPFRYQELMARSRAKKMIASVYVVAGVWSIVGVYDWRNRQGTSISVDRLCVNSNKIYYLISFLGIYVTSLLIITSVYIKILHIALSHIRSIVTFNTESSPSRPNRHISTASSPSSAMTNLRKKHSTRRKKELKTTKSIAIVYGAFVVCWLPSCLIVIITNLNVNIFPRLRHQNEIAFLFVYYAFIEVLPVLNTSLNPVIYSFSNKQFQTAFKRVICKLLGRQIHFESFWRESTRSNLSKYSEMSRIGSDVNKTNRSVNNNTPNKSRGWSQTSLDKM